MSKYINPDQSFLFGRQFRKGKGGGGGGATTLNPEVVALAKQGTFKPFTFTTSAGTAYGDEGAYGVDTASQYQALQQQALAGANQLTPQLLTALQQQPNQLAFNTNADQLTQDYFNQQSALLQPQFEQQANQLQNTLFGSGRMGLSLAGSAVGAGGQGMVNPDAYGLARAQSQTLADVGAQARERALADASARYNLESGLFGVNQAQQQQYLSNLTGGTTGLFGMGSQISAQDLELLKAGISAESLRGQSYTGAAQSMASGAAQPQKSEGKGGLLGAAAQVGSAYLMKP